MTTKASKIYKKNYTKKGVNQIVINLEDLELVTPELYLQVQLYYKDYLLILKFLEYKSLKQDFIKMALMLTTLSLDKIYRDLKFLIINNLVKDLGAALVLTQKGLNCLQKNHNINSKSTSAHHLYKAKSLAHSFVNFKYNRYSYKDMDNNFYIFSCKPVDSGNFTIYNIKAIYYNFTRDALSYKTVENIINSICKYLEKENIKINYKIGVALDLKYYYNTDFTKNNKENIKDFVKELNSAEGLDHGKIQKIFKIEKIREDYTLLKELKIDFYNTLLLD